jgi:hypothetical protein
MEVGREEAIYGRADAGTVFAAHSGAALDRLFTAASAARDRANSALDAESRGNFPEAIRLWRIVFNTNV